MFQRFKKRANTVFRKKRESTSTSQLQITHLSLQPGHIVTPNTGTDTTFNQTQTESTTNTEPETVLETTPPVVERSEVVVPRPPTPVPRSFLPPDPPLPPDPVINPRPKKTRRTSAPVTAPVPVPAPAPISQPATVVDLLHFDPEPVVAEPVADEPVADEPAVQDPSVDPFAPKYVPFIEASPLRNNMFATQNSRYPRINADIMGGFDDDSDSIWLVDDEETDPEDEERRNQQQQQQEEDQAVESEPESENEEDEELERTTEEDVQLTFEPVSPIQPTGATAGVAPHTGFRYHTPLLLDDDEWNTSPVTTEAPETQSSESGTTMTTTTTTTSTDSTTQKRGYAPISSSIMDLSNLGFPEDEMPVDEPEPKQNGTVLPVSPSTSTSTPAPAPASAFSSNNPYVALLEQQEQAMTVSYLRRLERSGDILADDFR